MLCSAHRHLRETGMTARRHTLTAEAGTGLGAAVAVLLVVSAIEVAEGPGPSVVAWLAVAPFLAAAFAPWRYVVGIGLLATLLATGAAIMNPSGISETDISTVIGMVLA